jgi:hypothetical protein
MLDSRDVFMGERAWARAVYFEEHFDIIRYLGRLGDKNKVMIY